MYKFTLFTQSSIIIVSGGGSLQALVINGGVKEEEACPSVLEIIIVYESVQGRIHLITLAQEKSLVCMATFVIPDLRILIYKGMSSRPASGTFWSLII